MNQNRPSNSTGWLEPTTGAPQRLVWPICSFLILVLFQCLVLPFNLIYGIIINKLFEIRLTLKLDQKV